ncbi:MAG: MurR/RpiR family transcriptional regulator [Bulleidia sp.]
MDLLSKIQLKKNALTANERKACDAIMEDMVLVQHHSLEELSNAIGVTKTSILRFCQKLGYSGYSEFKYDLINYVNSQHKQEGENDNRISAVENLYANAISLIHYSVTEEMVQNLVRDIRNARRVYIAGSINSGVAALQLRYALLMYGIDADLINSDEEMRSRDMCMKEDDLLILYSVSARTEMIVRAFDTREQNGCRIALITMNEKTPLKEKADHFICLPHVGTPQKSLLQDIPIAAVFNEIIIRFMNQNEQ